MAQGKRRVPERRGWEITARPGERMEVGLLEPEDKYPSLLFSKPSPSGNGRLIVRAGFLKGEPEMKLFTDFVDAMVDQIEAAIHTHEETRRKHRDN